MRNAITIGCLTLFLCACSSHNSSSQARRLTPDPATLPQAKEPPLQTNTRFAAGQLAEVRGKLDTAIRQYQAALALDPAHLPSMWRLGVIYAEMKNYDKSIEIWKNYIAVSNDAPEGYSNLAYCYELAGKPNLAEQTYKDALAKDTDNAPCRTNYGLMLARQGKIQEAIRTWSPVLTVAQIHYNLATVYAQDGRKQEARAEYQQALDHDPTLLDAKTRLSALDTNN